MEETTASSQEIVEEPGSLGSYVDASDRLPDLHGLTGPMGQVASEATPIQLPGQMEQKMVISLTEDQIFPRGQSPNLVVDSLIQCDDQSDTGAIQNRVSAFH